MSEDREDRRRIAQSTKAPLWLQVVSTVGLPGFLLLWLMGAFDGWIASPVTAAVRDHDKSTVRVLRVICYGIWRDDPGRCD